MHVTLEILISVYLEANTHTVYIKNSNIKISYLT